MVGETGRQTPVTNECKSVHGASVMREGVMSATETFNTRHVRGGRTARYVSSLVEETGTGCQVQAGQQMPGEWTCGMDSVLEWSAP